MEYLSGSKLGNPTKICKPNIECSLSMTLCMHGSRKFFQRVSNFDVVLFLVDEWIPNTTEIYEGPTLNAGLVAF